MYLKSKESFFLVFDFAKPQVFTRDFDSYIPQTKSHGQSF